MTDDEILAEMCGSVWPVLSPMIDRGEFNLRENVKRLMQRNNKSNMEICVLSVLAAQCNINPATGDDL